MLGEISNEIFGRRRRNDNFHIRLLFQTLSFILCGSGFRLFSIGFSGVACNVSLRVLCLTNGVLCIADEETDEFNFHIARYRPEELQKLASKTKFTRKEIQLMYRGFKQVSNKKAKTPAKLDI